MERRFWSQDTELLAEQLELTHQVLIALYRLGGAKSYELPKPLSVTRPAWLHKTATKPATPREMARFFGRR